VFYFLLSSQSRIQAHTKNFILSKRHLQEAQTKLQEAILVLRAFQNQEWPPPCKSSNYICGNSVKGRGVDDSSSVPTSILAKSASTKKTALHKQNSADGSAVSEEEFELDNDATAASSTTLDDSTTFTNNTPTIDDQQEADTTTATATRLVLDTTPAVAVVEEEDPLQSIADDDQNSVMAQRSQEVNNASSVAAVSLSSQDDDPQTREPMHTAVTLLLEALIKILANPATNRACELCLECINLLVKRGYVSGRAGGVNATVEHQSEHQPQSPGTPSPTAEAEPATTAAVTVSSPATLLHRLLESIAAASSETTAEGIQTAVLKAFQTIVTSPKCGVHEASMLLALRSTFHVYLVTKSTTCKTAAKQALLDMLRSVFSRMEAYDAVAKSQSSTWKPNMTRIIPPSPPPSPRTTAEGEKSVQPDDAESNSNPVANSSNNNLTAVASSFLSQYHTDSYVLFRALCKLSSKELPVDNANEPDRSRLFNTQIPATDPLALNSKILSLELILSAMDFCGDAFCQGERFIYLVQHYLCVSLLKNCMSNQTQVAFLSQKIFLVLVYKFKQHLKQEIEVFLSNIFLRVLDSPNSSFKQKALVLESLRSLCRDPSLLTQIFLNYDCDFDAMNLYKDIVHMLTKLGGKATSSLSTTITKKDAEQDFELSLAGIEVLVTILKAMLRALGLPGGEEAEADDKAGARIRGMLRLDVGLAALAEDATTGPFGAASTEGTDSFIPDDFSIIDREAGDPPLPTTTTTTANLETPAPDDGAASSDVAGKIVDAFEMKRNAEQNFEIGAVKFTLSLKSGLMFFIENGFVQCDARELALFFLAHKDKLDKTQMGEALGREPDAAFVKEKGVEGDKGGPGFWVRILHHYVDALDFTGMVFDEAIRLFLSGFRLPGEAQKIDRIMEKFAEKFTSQNPVSVRYILFSSEVCAHFSPH
jgi:brefeldin A-inhibited guanine nucleotide-exchange protein